MTASVVGGPRSWRATRDDDGHREYRIKHLVLTTSILDGPATVMDAAGLPFIGSFWAFGNDFDLFAYCTPQRTITIHQELEGDPNVWWMAESVFSTKPRNRCSDEQIDDPLLEPDRVSGSFVKYTEEATKDRNGDAIKSSSHEMLRGPQNEWDANRPTVSIEQNRATLGLETFSQMVDTVNDSALWGVGARRIKLSNVSWERVLFGTCDFYYIRRLEFDINFNTFDRDLMDEGTKALNGRWGTDGTWTLIDIGGSAPNPDNPAHFIRYKDRNYETARVLLNGAGLPLTDGDSPIYRHVEKYGESNFLALGIPTSF